MIVSKGVFYALSGGTCILVGVLAYLLFRKVKVFPFQAKIVAAAIVGLVSGYPWLAYRTTVIVVEDERAARQIVLGSADIELSNGQTAHVEGLPHGELIVNNTADTCVIERIEYYEDDQEMSTLSNYLILVKPFSALPFHGNEIEHLFQEAPEYVETYDRSKGPVVAHVLRVLRSSDYQFFSLYDGPVEWGEPLLPETH